MSSELLAPCSSSGPAPSVTGVAGTPARPHAHDAGAVLSQQSSSFAKPKMSNLTMSSELLVPRSDSGLAPPTVGVAGTPAHPHAHDLGTAAGKLAQPQPHVIHDVVAGTPAQLQSSHGVVVAGTLAQPQTHVGSVVAGKLAQPCAQAMDVEAGIPAQDQARVIVAANGGAGTPALPPFVYGGYAVPVSAPPTHTTPVMPYPWNAPPQMPSSSNGLAAPAPIGC